VDVHEAFDSRIHDDVDGETEQHDARQDGEDCNFYAKDVIKSIITRGVIPQSAYLLGTMMKNFFSEVDCQFNDDFDEDDE